MKLSLNKKKIPQRRLTFGELEESDKTTHQPIQEDAISEADFQSVQGGSLATDLLPAQISPITPRTEVIVHTGLTDSGCFQEKYYT